MTHPALSCRSHETAVIFQMLNLPSPLSPSLSLFPSLHPSFLSLHPPSRPSHDLTPQPAGSLRGCRGPGPSGAGMQTPSYRCFVAESVAAPGLHTRKWPGCSSLGGLSPRDPLPLRELTRRSTSKQSCANDAQRTKLPSGSLSPSCSSFPHSQPGVWCSRTFLIVHRNSLCNAK